MAAPAAVPDWISSASAALGMQPSGIIALVSSFAGVGAVSLLAILPYFYRLCRGHDVITECYIGRSIVTLSIDATGNGLHAARKLVVDINRRRMGLQDTGQSDSPPHGEPAAPEQASTGAEKPIPVPNPIRTGASS